MVVDAGRADAACSKLSVDYVINVRDSRRADRLAVAIRDDTTAQTLVLTQSVAPSHALGPSIRLVMPPRTLLGVPRTLSSQSAAWVCIRAHRRFASSTTSSPEIYDVVCVGGGPAGLSLLAGLKASPLTKGLKVALIEGQDLQKNRLQKDATLDSFSNRCSSLTPASVKNLQGTNKSMDRF